MLRSRTCLFPMVLVVLSVSPFLTAEARSAPVPLSELPHWGARFAYYNLARVIDVTYFDSPDRAGKHVCISGINPRTQETSRGCQTFRQEDKWGVLHNQLFLEFSASLLIGLTGVKWSRMLLH